MGSKRPRKKVSLGGRGGAGVGGWVVRVRRCIKGMRLICPACQMRLHRVDLWLSGVSEDCRGFVMVQHRFMWDPFFFDVSEGEEASACNNRRHRLGIEHTWRLFRVCFRDFYQVFDKGLCEGSTKGR